MEQQRYILLTMQEVSWLVAKNPITEVNDIAATDDDGVLLIFNTFDEAVNYQEQHGISGQIVELPLYDFTT